MSAVCWLPISPNTATDRASRWEQAAEPLPAPPWCMRCLGRAAAARGVRRLGSARLGSARRTASPPAGVPAGESCFTLAGRPAKSFCKRGKPRQGAGARRRGEALSGQQRAGCLPAPRGAALPPAASRCLPACHWQSQEGLGSAPAGRTDPSPSGAAVRAAELPLERGGLKLPSFLGLLSGRAPRRVVCCPFLGLSPSSAGLVSAPFLGLLPFQNCFAASVLSWQTSLCHQAPRVPGGMLGGAGGARSQRSR